MNRLPILFAIALFAACSKEAPVRPVDTREAIETDYVTTPTLEIHKAPQASSPVVTSYKLG